jgi:Ca-activated chloride channel homolog
MALPMSTRRIVLVLSLLACCPLVIIPGAVRDFSVRPAAQSCEPAKQKIITLSVTTKDGVPIDNLRAEDLIISEHKTPREILKLESQKEAPLSVAVMIDMSTSQERTLAGTKLAAREFVRSILRSDRDRAAVVAFTSDATIEQDWTNDLTKLRAAIDRVKIEHPVGHIGGRVVRGPVPIQNVPGATALWDSIEATVKGFHDDRGSRRLIVIFTDGEDTYSGASLRDATERAAASNVAVFSLGIADEKYFTVHRDQLQKLSEETGGRAFFPKKVAELEEVFLQTTRDLQSQYALTYCGTGPKPSEPVKIKIDLKNPALVQLKPRLSYPRYTY